MVAWLKDISNIGKVTNQIPIVGQAFSVPAAIAAGIQSGPGAAFEEYGKGFLSNVPGANLTVDALSKGASNIGSGGDPAGATEQFLQGRIPGMSYEQVFGSDPQGAQATASAIANELKGMPAADAQKFLAALSKAYPGSPLVTDITNAQSGATTAAAPENPFDTIGKILQGFSNQALPWLSQQMATSDKGSANLAAQMQSALAGASPAMRQAYSVGIPELQSANLSIDKAAQSSLATQPEWDTLISGLTDAAAAYKAATAAAQAEPYWSATTSGTAPSGSPGQSTLNTLYQQILGAQAAGH